MLACHDQIHGMCVQIASVPAAFGGAVPTSGISASLVVGQPVMAESDFTNAADMRGAVVFVSRGKVDFATKARRAQAAGAVALLVGQTADVWPYTMTDSKTNGEGVDIPVMMVRKSHAARFDPHLRLRLRLRPLCICASS